MAELTSQAAAVNAVDNMQLSIRYIQVNVFEAGTDVATGDGAAYFYIPAQMQGYELVEITAVVNTPGTTGTTDIQINNVVQAVDMLSTKLTIDSGEQSSATAATPVVIDTANDEVSEGDVISIDVDAVSTTPPQGLIVTLGFQLP